MIKKITAICLFLLNAWPDYAKQATVYGTVTGDDGKPVAYCVVKAAHSNRPVYSNETGEFSLDYNPDSSTSLLFFCLGYEKKEVNIGGKDTLRVVLIRSINRLEDAVITAGRKKGKTRHGTLGKRSLKAYGIATGFTGQEDAIFLQADSSRYGQLDKIYVYVTKDGIPSSRFRIHVYDIDTGYMPGNDLLDSNVIVHATEGNEWVCADVSPRHIPVRKSIFISVEWIPGYGNSTAMVTSKKYSAQPAFNGQVLGFTQGYFKRGSLLYCRREPNSKWNYASLGSGRKNILNLMIYATYTYVK